MIRGFKKSDYPFIESWAISKGITTLTRDQIPSWSTFIWEEDTVPKISISLLLPNALEVAYLEYFIADPEFRHPKRREMSKYLIEYTEDKARAFGYKKLVCLAPNAKLRDYYETFGYSPNLEGLTLMVKEIK
jgi:hypothetical protein